MSERLWRNVFIAGTLIFLAALVVMTVDSLREVTSGRTPPVTAEVAAGKRVWQASNCNDCHTILGIGGYFAPELTTVASRRGADWLHRFLVDGKTVVPGTTMPSQRLTEVQAANLVVFLDWVGRIDTNDWPPAPRLQTRGPAGAILFEQKGCSACHMIGGRGSDGPGPDLSRIGAVPYADLPNTPEGLTRWLADPPAVKADTVHPQIELTAAEIAALVQYLTGLR